MADESGSRRTDSAHVGLIGCEVADGQAADDRGSGLTCKLLLSREAREIQRPGGAASQQARPLNPRPHDLRGPVLVLPLTIVNAFH